MDEERKSEANGGLGSNIWKKGGKSSVSKTIYNNIVLDCDKESITGEISDQESYSIHNNGTCMSDTNAVGNSTKKDNYIVCDLCDFIVESDMELHYLQEHSEAYELNTTLVESVDSSSCQRALGEFVHDAIYHINSDASMLRVMQNACDQLNNIQLQEYCLFPYGSCVSLGYWDGVSDGDFAVLPLSSLSSKKENKDKFNEKKLLIQVMKRLRESGFKFEELEPVLHTRVPVVRRKCLIKQPCTASLDNGSFIIEYQFRDKRAYEVFTVCSDPKIKDHYHGENITDKNEKVLKLIYSFEKGANAIRLFGRREDAGVTKRWSPDGKLPEIFSIDFDITCSVEGVRNSWFLREYFCQDFLFRIGVLFLKKWSKQCGINNSRKGYLTSYAVSVLWVYYLLRSGYAMFVDPLEVPRLLTRSKLCVPYMPLWDPSTEVEHEQCINKLGKLLYGFFEFYTHFNWQEEVVSLRKDCSDVRNISTKEDLGWTKSKEVDSIFLKNRIYYHICIGDPFEPINLGRHLSPIKAGWVMSQFRAAYTLCCEWRSHSHSLSTGIGFPLLLDDILENYVDILRVAMYRYLIGSTNNGTATIRELRAALKMTNRTELSGYEMIHRLSDLWYDVDQMAEDNVNRATYPSRKSAEPGRQHPFLGEAAQGHDVWAVLSENAKLPPKGPTANDRVVFLVNSHIYGNIPDRATAPSKSGIGKHKYITNEGNADKDSQEDQNKVLAHAAMEPWMEDVSARISTAKEVFQNLVAKFNASTPKGKKAALCGVDLTSSFDNPLIRLQLFCFNNHGFLTHHERKQLVEHLNVVALTLKKEEIQAKIQCIMDKEMMSATDEKAAGLQNEKKSKGTTVNVTYMEGYRSRMIEAVSALVEADVNHKLNHTIVQHIISTSFYVKQPTVTQMKSPKDAKRHAWTITPFLLKLTSQSEQQHDDLKREKTGTDYNHRSRSRTRTRSSAKNELAACTQRKKCP